MKYLFLSVELHVHNHIFIFTQMNCQEMWDFAWECLTQEPQPSVRHLLEWLILCLAHRFPKFIKDLWTFFSEVRQILLGMID